VSRIGSYVAERCPLSIFGPAIVLFAVAILWIGGTAAFDTAASSLLLASLLVAKYRLWDDLEDVDRDRAAHPERVLVNGPLMPFRVLLATLTVAAAAACLAHWPAFQVLLALDCAFVIAYRVLRPSLTDHTWRYGVLLLKYPVLLAIAAYATVTVIPERLVAGAIAAYLLASGYERWHHDHRLQAGASS
jgi:hypothetical protein